MALFGWCVVLFVVAFASRSLLIRRYAPNRRAGFHRIELHRHWWEFVVTFAVAFLGIYIATFVLMPTNADISRSGGRWLAMLAVLQVVTLLGYFSATWLHNRRLSAANAALELGGVS